MFKWLLKTDEEKFDEQKAKEQEYTDSIYRCLILQCSAGFYAIDQEVNFSDYGELRDTLIKQEPFSIIMPNGNELFVNDFKNNMELLEWEFSTLKPTSSYRARGLDPKIHKE